MTKTIKTLPKGPPQNRCGSPSNFCSFNGPSLRHKLPEINNFFGSFSIHFLAISESRLGTSLPDRLVTIPGFQVPYRKEKNSNGGGVIFFVSNSLPFCLRVDLEHLQLELIWIEALLKNFHYLALHTSLWQLWRSTE